MISIQDLGRNVDGRWEFEFNGQRYQTSKFGDGLERWVTHQARWEQVCGRCQFSLAGKSRDAARSYIRRQFA